MIQTKVIKLDPLNPEEKYLKEAASMLKNGGLVIIPTETVYGIACDYTDKVAVSRLYDIKKRPKDKPLSFLIAQKDALEDYAIKIPPAAYKLIAKFWPGPLTLVLKSKNNSTVGLRMPDNLIALKIIEHADTLIVCPSANISGEAAPVEFETALKNLSGLVDLAVDGGKAKIGLESSVVDLSVEPLQVLREAALSKEEIEALARKKNVLFVCTGNSCRSVMAEALFKKKLAQNKRSDVEVSSAGVMFLSGLGATSATQDVLRKEGLDVSAHRSQKVTKELIKKSDIILVMEKIHEEKILQLAPEVKNRVFLLKEFAKMEGASFDIPDPIGRSKEFYEEIMAVIKTAVEKIAELI